MPVYHPHPNEYGKKVVLTKPSNCSGPEAWDCRDSHATVTPGSDMPDSVNGIAVRSWANSPTCSSGWEALVADCTFEEPPFPAVAGKKAASGAVVIEPDGRVWMISPSNQFGGYISTFPKGSVAGSDRISLRANAVKEAYEEMGLKIELRGYLVDSVRSTSVTRYYLGRRLDGCPSTMGWESQAVHLVPPALLHSVASHPNDAPILAALDLSMVTLTHHNLKNEGSRRLEVDGRDPTKLKPATETGTGKVQDKEKALLAEIIEKVNDLFGGDTSEGDQLSYLTTLRDKMLESEALVTQANNNTKAQFDDSPTLKNELMNAIMGALEAHSSLSKQALGSEKVREGLKGILLGPAQLYEALRAQPVS